MGYYADCAFQVRPDIAEAHARQIGQLGIPGTWGTGAQRLAVAAATRQAGIDAGLLEAPEDHARADDAALSRIARRLIERLAVSPADYDQAMYEQAMAGGLSDGQYVEIVGLVARVINFDIFARGIGVPLRRLPTATAGTPSRERPAVAVTELAWAPTVPNAPAGGEFALSLYGKNPRPYIMRALSLVPDEYRAHLVLEEAQYLPLDHILDYEYRHHAGLTRPQVEIVAGRISAINECFY